MRSQGAEVKKLQEVKFLASTVQCDGEGVKEVSAGSWTWWRKV